MGAVYENKGPRISPPNRRLLRVRTLIRCPEFRKPACDGKVFRLREGLGLPFADAVGRREKCQLFTVKYPHAGQGLACSVVSNSDGFLMCCNPE